MSHHVSFNGTLEYHDQNSTEPVPQSSSAGKVVWLIESRPLMGEIFSHALKEAAQDLDVRIMSSLEDTGPQASLAVLNLVQRSSDPLFLAFVIHQMQARIGKVPLLIITDSADPAIGRLVQEAGIQSWVTAAMGFDAVVAAIRQVLALPPRPEARSPEIRSLETRSSNGHSLFGTPASWPAKPQPERNLRSEIHINLTDREIDVLTLLQKGKQNKVIAHALNISESTAKVHIRNIMRKFHLRNRTEVALMCGTPARPPFEAMLIGPDYEDGQMAIPAISY